jgi:hypothetical protein
MPTPGLPGVLLLETSNVTELLDRYEDLCREAGKSDIDKANE